MTSSRRVRRDELEDARSASHDAPLGEPPFGVHGALLGEGGAQLLASIRVLGVEHPVQPLDVASSSEDVLEALVDEAGELRGVALEIAVGRFELVDGEPLPADVDEPAELGGVADAGGEQARSPRARDGPRERDEPVCAAAEAGEQRERHGVKDDPRRLMDRARGGEGRPVDPEEAERSGGVGSKPVALPGRHPERARGHDPDDEVVHDDVERLVRPPLREPRPSEE